MITPSLSGRSSHRTLLLPFAVFLIAFSLVLVARSADSASAEKAEFESAAPTLDSDPVGRAAMLTPEADFSSSPDPLLRRKGGGKNVDIGFADFLYNEESDSEKQLKKTKSTNADIIRVNMYWSLVAPTQPADPRNPDDPAYNWTQYDRAIVNASNMGFDVDLTVLAAPGWAEGPNRPDIEEAPPGSWKPDADAFGDFAHALAIRYSGTYVPGSSAPGTGTGTGGSSGGSGGLPPILPLPLRADETLPFVKYLEAWNEPNLSTYITPQWDGKDNVASDIYQKLLNAFYSEVKAVNDDFQVVSGGTAPYGDPPGGPNRTRPEDFYQELLCLTPKNKKTTCPNGGTPSNFDIIAHHPINREDPPTKHAIADGDVEVADFGELTTVLRKAEKAGTTGTPGHHDLWANEVWWQTNPPDKDEGVSLKTHARWTAQAIYLLWKQGASNVSFLQFRDAKYTKGEFTLASYQTGVYTFDDKRKPSADAVAFPFVTDKKGKGYIGWGIAPKSGTVKIEAKEKGKGDYRTVGSAKVKEGKVFQTNVKIKGEAKVRATVGGQRSLVWDQKN